MRATKTATALLCLGAMLAFASSASADAEPPEGAKPAWNLNLTSQATNFAPGLEGSITYGPEYLFVATNVGGAPTEGTVTVTVTLPEGLVPLDPGSSCTIVDQQIGCSFDGPVGPSGQLSLNLPVKVELTEGTVQTEATIEGGEAQAAAVSTQTTISASAAPFGFLPGAEGFSAPINEADGSATIQAGAHPFALTVNMSFPSRLEGILTGSGTPRDIYVDLPPGQIVNPAATPKCAEVQLTSGNCPEGSGIGIVTTTTAIVGPIPYSSYLYNMVPPPGTPSSFAFNAAGVGIFVHIIGAVRSDSDYGLSGGSRGILALGANPLLGARINFWGDPGSRSKEPTGQALLTAPVQCSGEQTITKARLDGWEEPDVFHEASYASADLGGTPSVISGCNQLQFEPEIEARPTTNLADSPSGLDFTLHQPTDERLETGKSPSIMKDTTVVLPQEMTVNPSSAQGQGACSVADANVHTLQKSACPDGSRLAEAEVTTPLLEEPLTGSVYLAKPFDNPFGSLLAIYLAIDDHKTGTVSNLAGEVHVDPLTGQLTTTFRETPQLPLEDVKLHFFTGPRASFRTPPTCGVYSTTTDIEPWSAPETANAHPSDSFAIQASPNGGTCPTSAEQAPNSPSFSAGTISPRAGVYSPFVLKVKREDATQPLAGIDTTLPPGLTGKLAGIAYCSEGAIAQALSRNKPNEGAIERDHPSCPSSSEVGEVDVAAGAGITPLHATGHAYLAGPYKGAPLSLVIITPAIAGPFDLGAVTVRTALHLDPETAVIHATSDPLPQILEGIPLDVRTISLTMGRPDFTLNPTSCDPMQVTGLVTSAFGNALGVSNPFQVGGCNELGFKPKLAIRLKGQTKRTGHPALTAVASFRAGDANTKFAQVTLPRSEFLDQAHIGTVCTRVQFKASQCPAASVYGEAEATTPLLDQPLKGLVYLRSSDHELPDLVIALKGQVDVVLAGRIDSVNGGIRTTFEAAPDAPVSKFTLKMRGGKKGLLINSADLCKLKPAQTRATVQMEGQNGKVNDFNPVVKSACGKAKKRGRGHHRGGHKKHGR
jgi:hypothetical protein